MVLVHHHNLAEPFHAVYKAAAAERPLFDFPDGTLARREVAAFLVSEAMGWGLIPPTVLREGPFGEGMVQEWIHPDPAADIVAMVMDPDPRLRRMAIFDAIVNNTDRKGGHLLPMPGGHVFGVDHGVTFSTVPKLRTVLWGWMGTPLTEEERAGDPDLLEGLAGQERVQPLDIDRDVGKLWHRSAFAGRSEVAAVIIHADHQGGVYRCES